MMLKFCCFCVQWDVKRNDAQVLLLGAWLKMPRVGQGVGGGLGGGGG